MNPGVVRAIFRKDLLSLWPLAALTALVFLGDAVITRLDLLPVWTTFGATVLWVALMVLTMSVFQTDSPASLTDDWLCRPVRVRELLAAKFALVLSAVYLARAVGAFAADLVLGLPVSAALLDALLLPGKLLPFMFLLFLFAAIVTRSFAQGFGVLFLIFICAFVIPTPFVRPPGPLDIGIRDELLSSGLHWLSVTPAQVAATLLTAAGFWLVYRRRRLAAARVLLAGTVLVTAIPLVLPMAPMPWSQTFALQKVAGAKLPGPGEASLDEISLHNLSHCFPATRRADISTDGAFVAAARGLPMWEDEALAEVSPDSIAFITRLAPLGLPLDWRAKLTFAQADYFAGDAKRHSLRPSQYVTDNHGGGLTHAWMLPGQAARELADATPRLELSYSLALLKPREYPLPVDDAWHELPRVGHCRARHRPGNTIDVECFSPFPSHAQLSAALEDIPATRVYSRVDFEPRWSRWPYGERIKLTVGSARLAVNESITLTAWDAAGYIDESIALPGILGADLATCPLPGAAPDRLQKARWRDAAPHEINSINVADGVQLEVLDFGGAGSPIVLLAGLGATAHAYDELAPQLAKNHRVIALTRRGVGDSSKPDFGYDTPTRARDVLAVLDELGLPKVLLVGHSIAGEELTWLGGQHGDRFSGLVYLDAAYDRKDWKHRDRFRELGRLLPPEPPRPPGVLLNFETMSRFLEERGHLPIPEGELIALWNVDEPFIAGTPSIDGRAQQAILAANRSPDYPALKIPALAIYAMMDADEPLPPWYDTGDAALRARLDERANLVREHQRENIAQFRREVAQGRVIELPDASHYIIQSNPREVLIAIEEFAAGL